MLEAREITIQSEHKNDKKRQILVKSSEIATRN